MSHHIHLSLTSLLILLFVLSACKEIEDDSDSTATDPKHMIYNFRALG